MLDDAIRAGLVTFREAIEASLIIAVISAYLRRTGRQDLIPGIRIGVGLSIITCVAGAYLWTSVPQQSLYEGIAAIVSALLVGAMLWQIQRAARTLKGDIEAAVARRVASPHATLGVALATALFVTREGMEAVLFLGLQVFVSGRVEIAVAAALGLAAGVGVALGFLRWGVRLHLPTLLRVTAVFLGLFLVQLLVYGVHELAESHVIPGSQAFHDATELFGPEGWVGHLISYSLVGAPLLYLLWARRAQKPRVAELPASDARASAA